MSQESTIRVIPFSGHTKYFPVWQCKHEAKAARKGHLDLLLGTEAVPPKSDYETALQVAEDERTDDQKRTIKSYKKSCEAYAEILLSMEGTSSKGRVAFNLVKCAKTVANPSGNPRIAWQRLLRKYTPPTATQYVMLQQRFANYEMRRGQEPDEFISDLETLMTKMNEINIRNKSTLTEVDLILHICCRSGPMYETSVHSIEQRLRDDTANDTDTCTLAFVREEFDAQFQRMKVARSNGGSGEHALWADDRHENFDTMVDVMTNLVSGMSMEEKANFVKQFKGMCRRCGKQGHKGVDCPDGKSDGDSGANLDGNSEDNSGGAKPRFRGKCFHCGIMGHRISECKKLKAAKERANYAHDVFDDESDDSSAGYDSIDELGFHCMDLKGDSVSDVGLCNECYHLGPVKNDQPLWQWHLDEAKLSGNGDTEDMRCDDVKDSTVRHGDFQDEDVIAMFELTSDDDMPHPPVCKKRKFDALHARHLDVEEGRAFKRAKYEHFSGLATIMEDADAVSDCGETQITESTVETSDDEHAFVMVNEGLGDGEQASACVIDGVTYGSFSKDTWMIDSGCTNHLTKDSSGMFNTIDIKEFYGGVGGKIVATKRGMKKFSVKQKDGTMKEITLNIDYSPHATENLLAVSKEMQRGATLSNDGEKNIILSYPWGVELIGDRRLRTRSGWISGVELLPVQERAYVNRGDTVTVNDLHETLGHPSFSLTKSTALANHVVFEDKPAKKCEVCEIAKARQRNVPKSTVPRSTVPGERLFIDISSPKVTSYGGSKHWLLVLDDATDLPFSFFLSHKDALSLNLVPFIKGLRADGIDVKIIRCDNAGENKQFERDCKKEGLGLTFEYTAPGTPQQNGRVERKFTTLFGRVRAMLKGSGIENPVRNRLFAEAGNTATELDGILVRGNKECSAFHQFFGKGKRSHIDIANTKTFGERCIVANRVKIKAKLADRGKLCYFVGYAKDHAIGTYRIFNPVTRKVIMSRDVSFVDTSADRLIQSKLPTDDSEDEISPADEWNRAAEPIVTDVNPNFNRIPFDNDEDIDDEPPPLVQGGYVTDSSDDESDDEEDAPRRPPIARRRTPPAESGRESRTRRILRSSRGTNEAMENSDADEPDSSQTNVEPANPKLLSAMRKLEASFNPDASKVMEHHRTERPTDANSDGATGSQVEDAGRDTSDDVQNVIEEEQLNYISDLCNYLANSSQISPATDDKTDKSKIDFSNFVEPKKFDGAWNHPDPYQQRKWREAITKEFNDMSKRNVWKVILRKDMPSGRRCVKCVWVFKIKRDGRFRARLCACGYSQIPGVDFTQNFSPVVNDMTFRMLITVMIYFGLAAKIVDVETAFLYGRLDEEIYMECPPGLSGVSKANVLSLGRCIYGLVQASRQYHKEIVRILKEIGFEGGEVDPCLLYKKSKLGICYVALYVDDNLFVGHPAAIDDAIKKLKEHDLVLKIEDTLKDYLSCEVAFSKDRKSAWMGQPHMMMKLEKMFGEEVAKLANYVTPGTPNQVLVREKEKVAMLPSEQHSRYRTGVGMLLYLVKYSRPDIANAVRELCKVLDGCNRAAYKEMLRVIKYVLDTKTLGLKMSPTGTIGDPWTIECFSDSDWATDPETRRSISGYIIYVHGVPICWKSKAQRSVSLSSTEAEWYALSEAVKDVLFLKQLIENMGLKLKLPITLRVDNIGAIFMTENVTSRTLHIRSRYVRELVEDGVIVVKFVRTDNNDSDVFTKNLASELHSRHAAKLVGNK